MLTCAPRGNPNGSVFDGSENKNAERVNGYGSEVVSLKKRGSVLSWCVDRVLGEGKAVAKRAIKGAKRRRGEMMICIFSLVFLGGVF